MDDPQQVFQQIRQLKLTQDDLKREIVEVSDGAMKVVLNGGLQFLELSVPGLAQKDTAALIKLLNQGVAQAHNKIMDPITNLTS